MIGRFSAILVAASIVSACSSSENESSETQLDIIAISPESTVFIPNSGNWPLQAELIAGAVSRGLLKFDGAGQIVPDMATSWRVSDDGKSIIFRLRRAQWSDGRVVKSDDFVRMFQSIMAPTSKHPFRSLLNVIENGEEVAAGRAPLKSLGVSAPLPDVVEIRLIAPRPSLLQVIAHPALGIADRSMATVALGPFKLDNSDAKIPTLLPNADFSDPGSIQVASIKMIAMPDAELALQTFKKRGASVLMGGTTGDYQLARAAGLDRLIKLDPIRGIYGYQPVHLKGPLADPRIRQALAMTIDREALVAATGAGSASPIYGVISWSLSDLPQPIAPEWVQKTPADRLLDAQQLIHAARGANASPLTLKVALPDAPDHASILQQVSASWAQINVQAVAVKWNDTKADLRVFETVSPADNASWFLNQYRCQTNNYCNPLVDKLLDQARHAQDLNKRRELLESAELRLVTDQPIIPLFTPIRWSVVDNSILGWTDNAPAQHPLSSLSRISTGSLLQKRDR